MPRSESRNAWRQTTGVLALTGPTHIVAWNWGGLNRAGQTDVAEACWQGLATRHCCQVELVVAYEVKVPLSRRPCGAGSPPLALTTLCPFTAGDVQRHRAGFKERRDV